MKVFVLGATGRVGSQIVDVALGRGHRVTAFVRSPQQLSPRYGLRIVAGDPLDSETLRNAMGGHDAVLSALGTSTPWRALHPSMTELTTAAVAAATAAGISRLAVLSGGLLFPQKGLSGAVLTWVLRHHTEDLAPMEATVTASQLEWTIARPSHLIHGSDKGYRAAPATLPEDGGRSVTFRAVAAFLVDVVERHEYVREIAGLAG